MELMIDYKEVSWWYWLVTVLFLSAGVLGWPTGFLIALFITAVQILHFVLLEGSIGAFPVQVRIGYFILLMIAMPEPMQLLYWVPVIGTWAQLIFGYCTMARLVSLLPWNRDEPFSMQLVKRTFLARPVRGNIMQGLPAETE